uniref:Uncharacterized protein n=1 Tax=Candidatus Kentrum sp. LPFa TaxID=2126335 RepID=A0A450X532_9GAMM|nr:MAG: hypothetical protein BECKLPF1236A_GA0070988_104161 [Candidatus Kentron sp. LPFa]VFK35616.1 MAG: hypothetical protein BECKLPF1236C_GA0070990_103991 [Candidatus Kentron sp. LPFa]
MTARDHAMTEVPKLNENLCVEKTNFRNFALGNDILVRKY